MILIGKLREISDPNSDDSLKGKAIQTKEPEYIF